MSKKDTEIWLNIQNESLKGIQRIADTFNKNEEQKETSEDIGYLKEEITFMKYIKSLTAKKQKEGLFLEVNKKITDRISEFENIISNS